jgi:hypothetical protein
MPDPIQEKLEFYLISQIKDQPNYFPMCVTCQWFLVIVNHSG